MIVVRRAGALALVAAAIAVWLLMAPDKPVMPEVQVQDSVTDRSSAISQALSDYELNENRAQGAPQQTVVNGWVTKDLLEILARQQNEALTRDAVSTPVTPIVPNDERIPALLGLLVLGAGLALLTTPRARRTTTAPVEARGDTLLPTNA
ncbi:hypothetical protein [Modestobacter excelsi]|uniref:hypothetical protein n=1 Tax=Modestobacter excelsi TaxID=2213161 RepID=UPI00110CF542|nr:hypothetical protein [Modestobacter excelsi]